MRCYHRIHVLPQMSPQVKIKTMELHPFDQLTTRFRLKRSQAGITDRFVGLPITGTNGLQQFTCTLDQFAL